MVGRVGPLATINGEPRQARKGAAATIDSGAGMWLARSTTRIFWWIARANSAVYWCLAASEVDFNRAETHPLKDKRASMSYQVLARKWRPRSFQEMAGQEHVLRAMVNALDSQRLHHAYLFTGTRGVGKTTIARILAKCLNCEQGVSSTPCGECRACTEIDQGRHMDLIEVDAASRTKVDETRELLENVPYAPSSGRFKVYLIDEVHMFTKHSFNALLKTLEEPPEHVKFLLATTDPQKMPVTVLSRCLQFNLKQIPVPVISGHLNKVLSEEGVPFEPLALDLVARAGEGSMRDALSLLDQAIAFGEGEVDAIGVQSMLGTVSEARRLELVEHIADGDGPTLLAAVSSLDAFAPDYEALLGDMLSILHAMALVQTVPEVGDLTIADADRLRALAARVPAADVQLYYQIALLGRRDMPLVPNPRQAFEMTLLRMMAFQPGAGGATSAPPVAAGQSPAQPASTAASVAPAAAQSSEGRVSLKEHLAQARRDGANRPSDVAAPVTPTAESSAADAPAETAPVVGASKNTSAAPSAELTSSAPAPAPAPAPSMANDAAINPDNWSEVIKAMGVAGMLQQLAVHCVPTECTDSLLRLTLVEQSSHLNAPSFVSRLEQAVQAYTGNNTRLVIDVGEVSAATPAQQAEQAIADRQAQAEKSIYDDPLVQDFQRQFDAEVQAGSIRPLDEPPEGYYE